MGLAAIPFAFQENHCSSIAYPKDVTHIHRHLPPISDFRKEWQSNNWSYAFAAHLVNQFSDVPWKKFVVDLFAALGMSRTSIFEGPDGNFARP